MTTSTNFVLIAALLLIAPAALMAQSAQNHDAHAGHAGTQMPSRRASPSFVQIDANKDGKISKDEMAKHPKAGHFSKMDADKDGFLNQDEFAGH